MKAPDHETALRNSREFHELMGLCLAHWQSVEHLTYMIFQHLAQCRTHRVGAIIFFHIRAMDQKLQLCDSIARIVLPEEMVPGWKDLLSRVKAASTKRDRIAHFRPAAFLQGDVQDYALMPNPSDHRNLDAIAKRSKHMTRLQLADFRDELVTLIADLNRFRLSLCGPLGTPQEFS